MLIDKPVNAIELSALRQEELAPLVEQLDHLDLVSVRIQGFSCPQFDRSFI